MELWTAWILGLAGSAHCAGMCGPLVLALPLSAGRGLARITGLSVYHAGRMLTYSVLGLLFGAVGRTLAMAGVQRWVSLGLGAAILLALLLGRNQGFNLPVGRAFNWLKAALGSMLRRRIPGSLALLGALNGLLPCGLVYVACAGATATGELVTGVQYMLVFGLGTVPMMLGLGLAGTCLQAALRRRIQRLVPVSLCVVAVLLILRGLALGIPFLSPNWSGEQQAGTCCHP